MSRVITDDGLLEWEAFASGGDFGFPERPYIVFNCLSDPDRRARSIEWPGDNADAEKALQELPDRELKALLGQAIELD
jgi:hypothetical protein